MVSLLLDAAIGHTKADLELVEGAAERLAPAAGRGEARADGGIGEVSRRRRA
ncbi:hypothetical protein ABZZ80_46720 [Streptomyces sp. NPDC006356]